MQPRPVGEPGVDHRGGPVEPQPERRDDALHDADDRVGVEVARHRFETSVALHEDPPGAVDHHFADRGIREQHLERAETFDVGDDRVNDRRGRRIGDEGRFVAEQDLEAGTQLVGREVRGIERHGEQPAVQRLAQRGAHAASLRIQPT